VEFGLSVDTAEPVAGWTLTVMDSSEQPIRIFTGNGLPPELLPWDGHTDYGELLAPGEIYLYQLEITHPDGTRSTSARRVFGVNRSTVVALELTGNAFEVDQAILSEHAKQVLSDAAAILAEYPDERILVEGHTDSQGGDSYNLSLSQRRAEAAAAYLTDELDLPESRISLDWYGEQQPIAPNDLAEGREINRRVEIKTSVEEVESTEVTDHYRTDPLARINDTPLDLGRHGRFSTQIDPDETPRLNVELINSHGRSARAEIAIPSLRVLTPNGTTLVSAARPENGCRLSDSGVVCRLEAVTDPGNVVLLDGHETLTMPDGMFREELPLEVGDHVIGILIRNAGGISRSANLAVTVRDRDSDGNVLVVTEAIPNLTVNLPAHGARLAESNLALSGHTDPDNRVWANDQALEVASDGRFDTVLELPAGQSRLVLRVEDSQGRTGTIERDVEVNRNQLFMMAFGDAEFGKLQSSGAFEEAGDGDDYYTEGRVAFYLKGRIRGKYLITAAFDSGREELGDLFSDLSGDEANRLLTNLDPDRYYPVYGDDSSVVFDVQSQGKLYLALDSETIQALIGNYPLALTDTELATYQRTLFGGRFIYRSASKSEFGDPNTEIVLFTADARNTHVSDELEATGGSLYYLSHRDIIQGSEEITLVVRDKLTGLALSRQRQRQNADYTIKYPEGRVMFHRPISSVVEDGTLIDHQILSGHPVFIQADYETVAQSFDETTSGTRLRQQIGDHVSVGGTYIDDGAGSGSYELAGVDTEIRPDRHSRLTFEYAESSGNDSLIYVSDDGGLNYAAVPASGLEEGSAWKAAAELDVGSWFGRPDRHQVDLYYKQLEDGFFSSGNFLEQGTEKAGIRGSFELTGHDSLQVRHDREDRSGSAVLPGAADESVLTSGMWRHQRERWQLAVEYQANETEDSAGSTLRETSIGAARFSSKITDKLQAEIEHQQTLSGRENDQTTAGLEYRALPSLALQLKGTEGDLGSSARAGAALTVGDSEVYLQERLTDDQDRNGHRGALALGSVQPGLLGVPDRKRRPWSAHDLAGRTATTVGQRSRIPPRAQRRIVEREHRVGQQSPIRRCGRCDLRQPEGHHRGIARRVASRGWRHGSRPVRDLQPLRLSTQRRPDAAGQVPLQQDAKPHDGHARGEDRRTLRGSGLPADTPRPVQLTGPLYPSARIPTPGRRRAVGVRIRDGCRIAGNVVPDQSTCGVGHQDCGAAPGRVRCGAAGERGQQVSGGPALQRHGLEADRHRLRVPHAASARGR